MAMDVIEVTSEDQIPTKTDGMDMKWANVKAYVDKSQGWAFLRETAAAEKRYTKDGLKALKKEITEHINALQAQKLQVQTLIDLFPA